MRRLHQALVGVASTCLLCGCGHHPRTGPINIILISIDSLRADHVHAYGYARETTPALDRLAREGAWFETVVAESSWTLPTHISMLTGLTTLVHGVEEETKRLSSELPTLASLLREHGYRTRGIFSAPLLEPIYGFGKGFEKYEEVEGEIAYGDERPGQAHGDSDASQTDRDTNPWSHRTVTSPAVTNRAIEFLDEVRNEKFFLFLHYFDVHYDYIPPEALWRKFDPDYRGELTGRNFARNPGIHQGMSRRDLEHIIALYDGEILFTDRHIGYLMDALERNGLAEKTLVVVTSDHGEEFFEHGNPGHGRSLYDEVLKVPLIVRLPGRIPPGARVSEQVGQVDIMPSILSLAGMEHEVGAADLFRAVDRAGALQPLPAVSRLVRDRGKNVWMSLRTARHKYLRHQLDRRNTSVELLFDLERDPGEQEPLLRRQAWGPDNRLEELERMRTDLGLHLQKEWSRRTGLVRGEEEDLELPPDLRERLRALGYIE